MYLSTASGRSRDSLASSSSRDKPVCFSNVSNTSGDRLLELGRRARFVRSRFDPGLRGLRLAALLEALNELAEPTAQNSTGTGTAETAAQLAEQAADATLPGSSGFALPESAEHVSNLVPVLVACDRK